MIVLLEKIGNAVYGKIVERAPADIGMKASRAGFTAEMHKGNFPAKKYQNINGTRGRISLENGINDGSYLHIP
jgi:hypothetical protein